MTSDAESALDANIVSLNDALPYLDKCAGHEALVPSGRGARHEQHLRAIRDGVANCAGNDRLLGLRGEGSSAGPMLRVLAVTRSAFIVAEFTPDPGDFATISRRPIASITSLDLKMPKIYAGLAGRGEVTPSTSQLQITFGDGTTTTVAHAEPDNEPPMPFVGVEWITPWGLAKALSLS